MQPAQPESVGEYCDDVCAVVVTYQPNELNLISNIEAVVRQVHKVYIVDNGSLAFPENFTKTFLPELSERITILHQSQNLGIGAAHNIGIAEAMKSCIGFVLLLDQDSVIDRSMVKALRDRYIDLATVGLKPGGLGPRYRDPVNGALSNFVKSGFRFRRHQLSTVLRDVVPTSFLVSSGTLIARDVLNAVGVMDESLFIDHVDTEWCLRAKSLGYCHFGAPFTVMTHALGEHRREIWVFRKRLISFHKPFRYYYIFRNSLLLYRRDYIPLMWKLNDIRRCTLAFFYFGFFSEARIEVLKMMLLGIWDGIKGVKGKARNS